MSAPLWTVDAMAAAMRVARAGALPDAVHGISIDSLVEANITHGDTLPFHMFWMRPMPGLHAYRTPTRGRYLSGNGTWPGNYISGISGHNASQAVLRDLREAGQAAEKTERVAR